MIRSTLALAIFLTAFALQPAVAQDHHQAFEQFAEFMEGSWTPAEQNNALRPIRHVYSWTLDGKFMRTNGTQDPGRAWDGFVGIEPKSGKLAWWGFFTTGEAGPIYLTKFTDDEWVFVADNVGADGQTKKSVSVKIVGNGKLHAHVIDTSGKEKKEIHEEWIRAATGKMANEAKKPHLWEYLVGDWEFTNSKGLKASITFETVAGGMASIGHWMTDDGKAAIETVGWNTDKKCLVVDGYGTSGNYWHVEYTTVGAKKCSGPSKVVYPDGSSVEGIMTIEKVDENTVKLHTDGKDENGQPIEVNSQWKRRTP
ncbi:hypothetical protein [Aureliella helgolandensis]|uniref:Uncharacterized protein n=1 Tax=Aureliella helgolandensis TaxID=2527968 RepID=A0A518G3K4_9BACT|nr:hypothetical protein [Aureliella helgolandensis]QDV23176.1 hypothetical protein Q31a_14740 [Aureliella helgolandensis]